MVQMYMADRIRSMVAEHLRVSERMIKGVDWLTYSDQKLATHAASLTQNVTGDRCTMVEYGSKFVLVRLDSSGKSVQPRIARNGEQ